MEDQLIEQPSQPIPSPVIEPEENPNLLPAKLITVFAETYTLMLKTQGAHWGAKGPDFLQLHLLHERIYEELYSGLDEIAELIRSMNVVVPASLPQLIEYSSIYSYPINSSSMQGLSLLPELLADHRTLLESLSDAAEVCNGCQGTLNLIGALSQRCLSHIYLIGSFLK